MPTYRARLGDKIISIEAESPEKAALQARLRFVGQGRADEVAADANARGQAALQGDEAYPRMPLTKLEHFSPDTPEGLINLGLGGASMAAAAPGAALGLAKDAAIYGAAEGAEKVLGLPSWMGEAVGAVGPAKSLGKLLLGGVFGGAKKAATTAVSKEATEAAAKQAASRAAQAAERVALKKKSLEIAERRLVLAEQKAAERAAKAGISAPKPAAAAPKMSAPVPEPGAPPVTPGPVAAPVAALPDTAEIVLKLQQQMGTSSGRKVVRELLGQMPPAQAVEIKRLLFKGQEHPATVLGKLFDPTKSQVGKVAQPGEELARLLGQIQ